jgi:tetratricopeptide (TPR) repeat protein
LSEINEQLVATLPAEPMRTHRLLSMAALIVLWGSLWLVYRPALHAPMIWDDQASIEVNSSIVKLQPLIGNLQNPGPLNPVPGGPTAGRPLVNLTLAINYHFGKFDPLGYHVLNLIVHMLSALVLWRAATRLLRLEHFQGRFDSAAEWLGFAAALIWALHPLSSEAVQYITQRTELLVGLCYLATIYFSLRWWSSHGIVWLILASAACCCGMACKEVMATAPLMALLLDRTLLSGSFATAMRRSWKLYVGLALGWVVLFALNHNSPRTNTAGFSIPDLPPAAWWMTQCKVLWIYLKLSVWPWPLLIHYDVPMLSFSSAWPWILASGAVVVVTLILLWRGNAIGMAGAWVLGILSPTSIVPLLYEVAQERRMYLPTAAIVLLLVAGGYWMLRKLDISHAAFVIAAMTFATSITFAAVNRHRLNFYLDPVALWRQAVDLQPSDYLAHDNLGYELSKLHHTDEAIAQYQRTLQLNPKITQAYNGLGLAFASMGQNDLAIVDFQKAHEMDPYDPDVQNNLGNILFQVGRFQEAIAQFQQVMANHPAYVEAHNNLGAALAKLGRNREAARQYLIALQLKPDYTRAYMNLTVAYMELQQPKLAVAAASKALELAQAQNDTKTAEQIQAWLSHNPGQ